jgi:chromosome segregation protein
VEESHRLQVELTEAAGQRRRIEERIETEWRKPLRALLEGFTPLDLDLETLEAEAARVVEQLETIGPVNPLAVEEHAEESKRLEFLTSQRDDLVSARQSLLQAIREIDGTARNLFLDTFTAVRGHFQNGLPDPLRRRRVRPAPRQPGRSARERDRDPRGAARQEDAAHPPALERRAHARGHVAAVQHLPHQAEPVLPAWTKWTRRSTTRTWAGSPAADEFKHSTQFIVITHNPRTMQAADAVYGVTMQEPGVSTIVGVRLGARR